ncbi:MAG: electron transfer flavoprotein subunit alpha/FixB family protein, partial [Actinomycetota bacterium]
MANVWVFVEEEAGSPATIGLELLTKARSMGEVTAVYLGEGADESFATLGQYGAGRVLHADPGDRLPSGPVAAALADVLAEASADLMLFGQSYTDRDVAGRLAARLGRSVLSNASEVELRDGSVVTTHEVFGGAQLATAEVSGDKPHLVLVRPKSFPAEPGEGASPEVTPLELPDAGQSAATVTESHVEEREGPQLGDAAVIVSGGRGLGSP